MSGTSQDVVQHQPKSILTEMRMYEALDCFTQLEVEFWGKIFIQISLTQSSLELRLEWSSIEVVSSTKKSVAVMHNIDIVMLGSSVMVEY